MGTDFVYASSYVRSQESKLLSSEQLRNMTESKNIDDICKVLQDAGYGSEGNTLTAANYQDVLKQAEASFFAEAKELSKSSAALNIFCYPADYHNLKVLLKAEALDIDRDELLMGNGTISASEMVKSVKERETIGLTENMARALTEAIDVHARTNDPQMIDFVCDKYCFADIIEAAEQSKNSYVMGYVALWIDTINLKTFARVKKMGQPWKYFENVFIPGGTVDVQVFLGSYEDDFKQAAEKFQAYDIRKAVSEGGEAIDNSGDFTLLEKICDNLLVEYSREAKTVTFGLEPLVAYLIARQNEIKAIRIVLAGKLAKMSPELIRERLRETYE
ncbi:V-type ATP synthase subunit C [Mogibacterium pumilum]|uniref:V-type ATP synthase subunit C n=1 Tax=Mogibacterium pumilum TaxID=86332 RepID=A0A223AQ20_9FIRM|nr:V-type ATP synthase subunit C [Mogibacterium pumilum]ASS37054.1 hypothetical protein AXF17_00210 [Mogibacterium pumilum]